MLSETGALSFFLICVCRAGPALPRNFDRIPISRLQIEKLNELQIEYDTEIGHRHDGVFEPNEDEDEDADENG